MDLPYNLIHAANENEDSKNRPRITLDQRRIAALADVDDAAFSWYHVKIALVASVGFFTDAYDIFAINIAAMMLGYVYNSQSVNPIEPGMDFSVTLSKNQDLGVKVATPVGTLIGQLLFGWLADVLGRKKMYGFELMVIILGTFGQVLAGEASAVNIINVIIVWRVIMGIGIGGDYPLSAVISSEFSATKFRGRLMTAVFSAQGWGTLAAGIVAVIIVAAFKGTLLHEQPTDLKACDFMWRLLIGLGCIPACIALYFRLTIPESPRFTMDIERNVQQAVDDVENYFKYGTFEVDPDIVIQRADAPRATRRDFFAYFGRRENLKVLVGTSWSWFALDVAFYGLSLNNAIIFQAIGVGSPPQNQGTFTVYESLKDVCVANIIAAIAGLIPGFYATMLLIDSWGRKPIQFMGFAMLTVLFVILGFGYKAMQAHVAGRKVFLFLYCVANFFQNFGPNTTTFIVPGEAFPTRYRSTAHGISAASGKLGAIIAQVGFAQMRNIGGTNAFVDHILEIFALFMLTGVFSTLLIPETKGRSLEDLSNESQRGFVTERNGVELQQRNV